MTVPKQDEKGPEAAGDWIVPLPARDSRRVKGKTDGRRDVHRRDFCLCPMVLFYARQAERIRNRPFILRLEKSGCRNLSYGGLEGAKGNSHLILTGAEDGLVHRFCHRR